jgi:hypothetical protein
VSLLNQRPPLAATAPLPGIRDRQTYGWERLPDESRDHGVRVLMALDQVHPWHAIPEDNWA